MPTRRSATPFASPAAAWRTSCTAARRLPPEQAGPARPRRTAMNPAATFSYEEVRAQIFAQHDELLRLLRTAGALASAAAGGDGVCREEVPRFLDTLMGKLHAHLDYEAANLVPLLEGGEAAE